MTLERPSEEKSVLSICPPTATNRFPVHAMDCRLSVIPEVLLVQMIPSGEVRTTPEFPTAASCPAPCPWPVQTIAFKHVVVPEFLIVHVSPSGDVHRAPFSPTATSCPPDPDDEPVQTTASSLLEIPDVFIVHAAPTGFFEKVALTIQSTFMMAVSDVSLESAFEKSPPHASSR
jgi:hypothetical protein